MTELSSYLLRLILLIYTSDPLLLEFSDDFNSYKDDLLANESSSGFYAILLYLLEEPIFDLHFFKISFYKLSLIYMFYLFLKSIRRYSRLKSTSCSSRPFSTLSLSSFILLILPKQMAQQV